MKEPVDHILRPSLPWREAASITECGYDASKVKAITRAEFFQRFKDMGRQRCALFTCMTCADTASRWKTWEAEPRQALNREIEWERRAERGDLLKQELIAIAALIDAHREEFDGIILANQQRQEWLAKKAEVESRKNRPQPPRPTTSL